MKAMVLTKPGELALDEMARPQAGPGQVLVQVTHSGICGTDLKIYSGAIPVRYPRVMGHEMIGEVADAGGRADLKAGQRVVVDPMVYCGACFHCRVGQSHLCPNGVLLGRDANGGFAEFVAVPANHVYPLPDSIGGHTAALLQVMTTCLHAQRLSKMFPGESAVVLGLGVTGQLHVQLAKARGAHPVIGVTRSRFKSELARQLGADLVIAPGERAVDQIREATHGRGADLVIECTGMVPSLASAVNMARIGGRLLLFGIITAKEGALPFYDLYYKELEVINARVAKDEDFPASIDLVERGVVKLEPLVTHVMSLGELKPALAMLKDDADQRMKIILRHN